MEGPPTSEITKHVRKLTPEQPDTQCSCISPVGFRQDKLHEVLPVLNTRPRISFAPIIYSPTQQNALLLRSQMLAAKISKAVQINDWDFKMSSKY